MGGAHSQAVAEAPSKEVVDVEAPSQDVVETGAPPETSPTSAAGGLHESEEPRYPNRKDAMARGAEDDSGTECAVIDGLRVGRPVAASGRRRTRLPASDKKRNYQTRVSLEWTPEIPAGFSVPAVFICGLAPAPVQRKAGFDSKNVPICIPF